MRTVTKERYQDFHDGNTTQVVQVCSVAKRFECLNFQCCGCRELSGDLQEIEQDLKGEGYTHHITTSGPTSRMEGHILSNNEAMVEFGGMKGVIKLTKKYL